MSVCAGQGTKTRPRPNMALALLTKLNMMSAAVRTQALDREARLRSAENRAASGDACNAAEAVAEAGLEGARRLWSERLFAAAARVSGCA